MSLIDSYLKTAGSGWAKAENVQKGAKMLVEQIWLDDTSFDKSYICASGAWTHNNEGIKVRLGVKNVKRISETLGRDEKGWIGNYLVVLGIEDYPGVSGKGILWDGVKAAPVPGKLPS